jgi:hypothetical protein
VPPVMAAGLTDHVWTMEKWLSFRVPPKQSDTPGEAGGLMSGTASKAVGSCERVKNALLPRRLPAPE